MRKLTDRKTCLAASLAITVLTTASAAAGASAGDSARDSWPQRMVRVIVPVSAGSATDSAARIFGERLADRWKQAVVIENRAGADGLIGVTAFAGTNDSHVLMYSPAAPISVFPAIHEKLPYDPTRDIVPIASATDSFGTISVSASSNLGALAEFVARARSRPGKLNCTSAAGAFRYLLAGFLQSEGLDVASISYREQVLAIQDLAEGRLDCMVSTTGSLLPLVKAGKLRFLAVTNNRRSPSMPGVPTATEAGFPELWFEGFQGFFAGRDMSMELRSRIAADIASVASEPVLAARMPALDQIAHATTPAEFSEMIEIQRTKIADIVKRTGVKPEP
jgi:tripartite-type tricarboxylate transporter receptor subunit TctC